MYALIEDNAITRTTGNIKSEFPNTSFPRHLPDEHEGWVKVIDNGGAPFTTRGDIDLVDGVPTQTYVERDGAKQAHLANYRENKIQQGITVNGLTLGGDDKTMLRVAGARIKADADNTFTTKWNGSTVLNAAAIIAVSDAMLAHVDKCFDAYGAVLEDIADYTTPQEIEDAFDAAYES
jgi:hypothetical protein